MRGVNKTITVGTLGADPEVKQFSNGGSITTISVAVSEKWTDKQTGQPKENTEWLRIVFNNKLAEIAAQYLRKGSQVYVEGSLRTRKYQDQNGQDRYVTEIRADQMQMLGGNQNAQQQNNQAPQGYQQPQTQLQQNNAPQAQTAYAPPVQGAPNWSQRPQTSQGYAHNPAPLPIPKAGVIDEDVPFNALNGQLAHLI